MNDNPQRCETCLLLFEDTAQGRSDYMICVWEPPSFPTPFCNHGFDIREGLRRASEHHRRWQSRGHVYGTADICTKFGHAKAGSGCPCWVDKSASIENDDDFASCEGCGKKIHVGDPCHHDRENGVNLCVNCAPTYEDLRAEPGAFRNGSAAGEREGEPMTVEEAEAWIAEHLGAGGALSDKITTPY